MNRRLWTGVAITVTAMSGLSFGWGPGRLGIGLRWIKAAATRAVALLDTLPWPIVAATATLAALVGILALRWERRRRVGESEPWRTVIEMGKQGRSASAIARRTGLPQDAVRIVLAPVAVDPSFPRGNSFRPSSPPPARRPRSKPPRRRT